jgi:hypothetical protein
LPCSGKRYTARATTLRRLANSEPVFPFVITGLTAH